MIFADVICKIFLEPFPGVNKTCRRGKTRTGADHDTTLTNVAVGRGICLAPGFLNDHSSQFAWIPFDCKESFSCVLCTHKEDQRDSLKAFLAILKKLYSDAVAFPL